DRRIGAEHELGKSLLAEAVVETPLEGAQLALRDAICRPGRIRLLRARRGHEVGKILQPNALAVLRVASGTGEIMRPAAIVEQSLADAVRLDLLRMAHRNVHFDAARFGRYVCGQRLEIGLAVIPIAKRLPFRIGLCVTLPL